MQRIATPTRAVDLFGTGKHGFRDGDLGLGVAPTDLEAVWFNDLQEELVGIIEGAGLTPTAGVRTQLSQAIQSTVKQIQPITASVAANALTITLQPTALQFRSATPGSGAISSIITTTPVTLTVPSGATLGGVNAIKQRLAVVAMNNAGAVELAVVGGFPAALDESALASTTIMSAASDSAGVMYSAVARTNLPFRIVGFIESTQAVAGTWATAPSLVQGMGGAVRTLKRPIFGSSSVNAANTTTSTSVTFTAPGPGLLVVSGITNYSAVGGSNTSTLAINGVSVGTDNTTLTRAHFGCQYTEGGSVTAELTGACSVAFALWLSLIFIPEA